MDPPAIQPAGFSSWPLALAACHLRALCLARGVTAELRDMALSGRTPAQSYDGIAWLYDGP